MAYPWPRVGGAEAAELITAKLLRFNFIHSLVEHNKNPPLHTPMTILPPAPATSPVFVGWKEGEPLGFERPRQIFTTPIHPGPVASSSKALIWEPLHALPAQVLMQHWEGLTHVGATKTLEEIEKCIILKRGQRGVTS